ncbi:MAG: ribbon-helix-helix protein, CopG family [Pseudomonas sp.]|nr:MAG: ribbon-helix-helix protein, CopG family [Pseudomonas sp.]
MGSVTLRVPDELLNRINQLSLTSGRTKSYLINQAISEHISELEDLYLSEMRLMEIRARRNNTYSINEVENELGLAD